VGCTDDSEAPAVAIGSVASSQATLAKVEKSGIKFSGHTTWHTGRMPDDLAFTLRQLEQARGDL